MENTNEQLDIAYPTVLNTPSTPPSHGAIEHIIPQMVVTSVDDELITEPVCEVSSQEPEVSVSEVSDVQNTKETTDNVISEVPHDVQNVYISTEERTETDQDTPYSNEQEVNSVDSVSSSVIQRPLIIESDRCVSPSNAETESNVPSESHVLPYSETPSPSPSVITITTMQRPLIFDGSSQSAEIAAPVDEEKHNINPPDLALEKYIPSVTIEEPLPLDEAVPKTETESKPKSSPFSWMPSLPKLHASGKEEKSHKEIDPKDKKTQDAESPVKKDGLQNVKKFFDNLLHDSPTTSTAKPPEQEQHKKDMPVWSHLQQETEPTAKKDNLQNVKNFFDNLLHDSTDPKVTSSEEGAHKEPEAAVKKDHKDSKHGFKIFKHSKEPLKPEDVVFSYEVAKDQKKGVMKIFDPFKHDSTEVKDSSKETKMDAAKTPKESKSGIKKFFDSFKHEPEHVLKEEDPTPLPPEGDMVVAENQTIAVSKMTEKQNIEISVSKTPDVSVEAKGKDIKEAKDPKPKSKDSGIKKLFHFKSDSPGTSEIKSEPHHVQFADRDSLKRSHSFKDSILLKDEHTIAGEKATKDGFPNVKKYFAQFKHGDPEGSIKTDEKKSAKVKRSQSWKEISAEKEGSSHGVRHFLDSIAHKSILKSTSKPVTKPSEEEHIYDPVGKPGQVSAGDAIVKSETFSDVKHKDEHTGMRKIFDTFRHRDSSPKIKTPKDVDKNDKIYEKIDISSAIPGTSKQSHISNETKFEKIDIPTPAPSTSQPIQSSAESGSDFKPAPISLNVECTKKEIPTIVLNVPEYESSVIDEKENKEKIVKENAHATEPKTSVLSSISGNLMALKDKIIHPKDSKKADINLNHDGASEVFKEYDLESAASKSNEIDSSVGTYKPIKEDIIITPKPKFEQNIPKDAAVKPNVSKPSQSREEPTATDPKTKNKTGFKFGIPGKAEPGTPETLYDTCCIRLANLLGKKALEIVHDKTKGPPKKPPKPTAEAIAKARAAVVSQRLRNIQNKGLSIGESIPVGYDGIRFADDETESSCDYKDVENFDYIMDYELINRYKCDGKSFSDPSICSGISSYYTADTVTLKDENLSDSHMENVSLGSNDSFHMPSAPNKPDFYSLPTRGKSDKREKSKSFTSSNDFNTKIPLKQPSKSFSHSVSPGKRKVPPPLPPKPNIIPKPRGLQKKVPNAVSNSPEPSLSQCINGLSLSPRLQTKYSKDAAKTRQRPLMVAGFKGTEFTSLQTKHSQSKAAKERTFNTILKNESLKTVSTIKPIHKPLQSTKSSPAHSVQFQIHSEISPLKKQSPKRPPLPTTSALSSEPQLVKTKMVAPPVPEKPKRESAPQDSVLAVEKRTISPPRPPPPVLQKIVSPPPPRPPPPTPNYKSLERHAKDEMHDVKHSIGEKTRVEIVNEKSELIDQTIVSQIPVSSHTVDNRYQNVDQSEERYETPLGSFEDHSVEKSSDYIDAEDRYEPITPYDGEYPTEPMVELTKPMPPPRGRRIRSRTVELPPKEKSPEQTLRRSQSLSDLDIQKKVSQLEVQRPSEKSDLKHLYTSVNKNGKKQASGSQSPNVSTRPLPAPPPPPRKFRSLDRKPKNKDKPSTQADIKTDSSFSTEIICEDTTIKPPERKKKSDKFRFQSLSAERKKVDPELTEITRSSSMPLRPERRPRQTLPEFDENANIAFSTVAEIHQSPIMLDECGNEIHEPSSSHIPATDEADAVKPSLPAKISPRPRQRKDKKKSHSSWYDESQPSEDWEMVDWNSNVDVQAEFNSLHGTAVGPPDRRRSDPMPSPRRTSKFYVDVEVGEPCSPLVDKETSPLHIDQSEKSVQTSLETLSQDIVSRDEENDEVESSDTDNLLNIVKTLQSELKSTLNRHKSLDDDETDESNVPVGGDKLEEPKSQFLKTPSVQSSASELWVITSSEESDVEISNEGSSTNLSDTALTRKKNKIFYIAQEMMTSEEVFVDTLKLLNVEFKAFIEAASQQKNTPVVPDEVLSQILNHLPQLQHLNENLLMDLKDRIENWDKIEKIADVIVKIGPFLKLYSWFIHDFESNLALLEESKRRYPLFAQTVKEFEASPRCKRLTINHYMLKPIQRIPQYRLLLQEYLHQLSEDSVDYQDTVTALQIVSEVANHANESMKQGDNAQKLISIQNSIMGRHKEIIKPGRLFVKEGELMKLSRKGMQPRWFVLFNDLLLYLSPVQQGLFKINHEFLLTGMKVAIPIQQDYQNEFSIISVARSFTLAARSPEERQEWIVALTKAIEENASKRSTFNKIRLLQKAQETNSEDEEEFVLGKRAPVWIPDARVTMCQLCTSEFTVTFRRHHCRACGKVVCSICSSNRIPLAYLGGTKVNRVCDDCFSKLGAGYAEGGETDSDNQQIAVKSHLRSENRGVKKGKRNLPSVLKEVCANDQGSTISGYLQKKSGKSWKKEWFVVKDKVLYEYKASEDVAALKSVPLLGYQIEPFSEPYESVDPSLLFQLTHPGQAPIIFHTDSVGSTERWIAALRVASVLE